VTQVDSSQEKLDTPPEGGSWFNRNVLGMGLTSLFADLCYETATAVLPILLKLLGAPVYALGLTEGLADALSSFTKMISGTYSDRLVRRKPLVVAGYTITAASIGLLAVASLWPVILLLRGLAWFGKGLRGPARNALLAESVAEKDRGKAFGVHRAGDTIGAIFGPLLAAWLLGQVGESTVDALGAVRTVLWWTWLPGVGSVLAMALLVKEGRHVPGPPRSLLVTLRGLPRKFRRFLGAVAVFGTGDFSHSLLILAAIDLLEPTHGVKVAAQWGAVLFSVRNIVGAAGAFPAGWLGDKFGHGRALVATYGLGAVTSAGFAALMWIHVPSIAWLAVLFAAAGLVNAAQEAIEGAATADLIPDRSSRGTAYGVLGTVNGLGDFVSSFAVGLLWAISPAIGLGWAAAVMGIGTVLLAFSGYVKSSPINEA